RPPRPGPPLFPYTTLFRSAAGEEAFTLAQVRLGAEIFERNCAPCHGPRMQDPESAFDLRKFPRNQHDRFVSSVTRGKNQMPPWGDRKSTRLNSSHSQISYA